jgi:hypothetical protein
MMRTRGDLTGGGGPGRGRVSLEPPGVQRVYRMPCEQRAQPGPYCQHTSQHRRFSLVPLWRLEHCEPGTEHLQTRGSHSTLRRLKLFLSSGGTLSQGFL